jgi:murein DD-endopeptidase MepM/ murein hydrolase activator NlpD
MSKEKFYYDPKIDTYVKIYRSNKRKFFKFFLFLGSSTMVAAAMLFVLFKFFGSPKEKQLQRELDNMTLQYKILNEELVEVNHVLADMQDRDDNIYRVIFEAEPIDVSIRNAGFGGAKRYEHYEGFENSDLIVETKRNIDRISKKMYVQSKSLDEVVTMTKNKAKMVSAIPAIQPVANKNLKRMASGYGYRIHPIYKTRRFHKGMDFSAPKGTPIYATGDGKVTKVKRSRRGYGNIVKIDHGYGYETFYAHMDRYLVKRGQKVHRGDIIGFVGTSGTSTAPHLHYEVIKNGRKVNPVNYYFNDLSPEEYDIMIKLASQENQSFD